MHSECPNDAELSAFAVGDLTPAALESIAAHAGDCADCQARLEGMGEHTDAVLRALRRPPAEQPAEDSFLRAFEDQGRYRILQELGRGGMGVAYRAWDARRQAEVALKTLQGMGASLLYRFKNEFRSLAGVTHPNLVALHELVSDGQTWFFTMELIEGVDFYHYVRTSPDEVVIDEESTEAVPATSEFTPSSPDLNMEDRAVTEATVPCQHPARGLTAAQIDRLRPALRQLAEGLSALHAAGKLHRDLKPANVLVTRQGRVVILDFGLAAELDRSGRHQSSVATIVGTLPYMAPEQAEASAVSPASDWYSFGIMLFEALTGLLPFEGSVTRILQDKQRLDPPPPSTLVAGVPVDLDTLCVELLRRNPAQRPSGPEALRRLAGATPDRPRPAPALFVGRARELAALAGAFRTLREGRTLSVRLWGPSGAGKSALLRRFAEDLREREGAVVLAGRCYEQESVPFKAFDSLVDALSRYLVRLPQPEAAALLPRDVASLVRVFAVLQQVPAVARAPRREAAADPQELRRRAFAALRELLARLGDRRPLVLLIDDLQWGDVDSAALLAELLRPPDPPALLLLTAHRGNAQGGSVALQAFLAAEEQAAVERRTLEVGPLDDDAARALARSLLTDPAGAAAPERVETIAREARGNPFFVVELTQHLHSGAMPAAADLGLLERVLRERVRSLGEAERRLLEVAAVAGRPLRQGDACRAAEAGLDALTLLRSARLLRGTGLQEADEVEPYHDRVREAVLASLSAGSLREHHRRLALVLEASGQAEPALLAVHFEGAGEPARAAPHAVRAAERAAAALAFDRAAQLYRLALRLLPELPAAEECELRRRLADALGGAGRGAEAAAEYLAAADRAGAEAALSLRRQAAEHYLRSGREEGLAVLRQVLTEVGLDLPATPRRALLGLIGRRLWLWLRGLRFRERPAEQVPARELARIDACLSAVRGLTLTDPVRGMYFQTRGLLLALRAGEPVRLTHLLLTEINNLSFAGGRGRRIAHIWQLIEGLRQCQDRPFLSALALFTRGLDCFLAGRWRTAREQLSACEELLRQRCAGVPAELVMVQMFGLASLMYLGRMKELARQLPTVLEELREYEDRLTVRQLRLFQQVMVRLAADDVEGAGDGWHEVMAQAPAGGFLVEHYLGLQAGVWLKLYVGDGASAWRLLSERWPAYAASQLRFMQKIRMDMHLLRAGAALAAAGSHPRNRSLLRLAEREVRRVEREAMPWGDALARLLRAGLSFRSGDTSGAREQLEEAMHRLEAVDMGLHAAAARRCLGQLTGGEEGRKLVADADAWMAAEQVRNSARMTALLAPAFTVPPAPGAPG